MSGVLALVLEYRDLYIGCGVLKEERSQQLVFIIVFPLSYSFYYLYNIFSSFISYLIFV